MQGILHRLRLPSSCMHASGQELAARAAAQRTRFLELRAAAFGVSLGFARSRGQNFLRKETT